MGLQRGFKPSIKKSVRLESIGWKGLHDQEIPPTISQGAMLLRSASSLSSTGVRLRSSHRALSSTSDYLSSQAKIPVSSAAVSRSLSQMNQNNRTIHSHTDKSTPLVSRSSIPKSPLSPTHFSTAAMSHNEYSREVTPSKIDFGNPETAFGNKSSFELLRSYLIFRLCTVGPLVRNADTVLEMTKVRRNG